MTTSDGPPPRRSRALDSLLGVVTAGGLLLGPLAALWAFLDSPCGPDSTRDVCVLAAPHVTAVLLPLIGGPAVAVLTPVLGYALRRRPPARRRALVAGVLVLAAVLVVPSVIVAVASTSYPNDHVPRS